VAVLAFKAVYTLEVTRRENDRRVLALYTEYAVEIPSEVDLCLTNARMKDMMAVLIQ